MNDLISIIIPVYNIEAYLRRCLDSVCGQTYHNLEIIVVDDGSTDSSGTICEEYGKRDSRIKVIHKQNGGLSDARNVGMAFATGKYIGYVDGDDWIDPDMYRILHSLCESNNLDLIAARFIEEIQGKDSNNKFSNEFRVLDGIELLRYNIADNPKCIVTNSVWDRLYRRELLNGLLFPVGKCYEDTCYSAEVFLRARRCGYLDAGLYHYVIREDSIMGQGIKSEESFNNNILSDLLPQMKRKADIIYSAGLLDMGDRCLYMYLHTILDYMVRLYNKRGLYKQYCALKEEYDKNKKWLKRYVNQTERGMRAVGIKISCVSMPLYVFVVRKKRYISQKWSRLDSM